jgi:hypothetical protein
MFGLPYGSAAAPADAGSVRRALGDRRQAAFAYDEAKLGLPAARKPPLAMAGVLAGRWWWSAW